MTALGLDKDEAVWLVKSGDRILGPFTREDIKTKLYAKELVVIDEVITPMRRWRYIRDEPAFAVVVEDIRKSNLGSREDTELGTFSNTTTTGGTGDIIDDFDEQTMVPDSVNEATNPEMIAEAEVVSEQTIQPSKPEGSTGGVKSYGSGQDQRVQQSLNRNSRVIWAVTVVVLVSAGIAFWRFQGLRNSANSLDVQKVLREANNHSEYGNFQQATVLYKKIFDAGYDDPDFLLRYAAAALKSGDERAPVRFIELIGINRLKLSDSAQRAKQETIQGLAALQAWRDGDGRQLSAARDFFTAAKLSDPKLIAAHFNRGMVEFLDISSQTKSDEIIRDFVEAESLAKESKDPHDRGSWIAAQMMIARTRLKSRDPFQAERVREYLESLTKSLIQFWQEAQLLRAYASTITGKSELIGKLPGELKVMLSGDPFLTDEHYLDPLLYVRPLTWDELHPLCMDTARIASTVVGPSRQPSAYAEAARLFCEIKQGDRATRARQALEKLVFQNQGDTMLRSLLAFSFMKLDEARAAAELAPISANPDDLLGLTLLGRLCAADDWSCVDRFFGRSTLATPDPAQLILGAARQDLVENDPRGAEVKIERIRQKSPHYIPLMTLDRERGEK